MIQAQMTHPRQLLGYDVLGVLGHGARSTIYAVKDKNHQVFALKHVIKQGPEDQRFLDQALAEHDIASRFDHPHLRHSYQVIRHRKLIRTQEIVLLMEFVDGPTLEELRIKDPLRLCELGLQVASSLKVMHDAGYVHADIKPNNILVGDGDTAKVIDFGQSCEVGAVKERIQGTPDYIAPEQVHRHPITPRTDVFNLGATLYVLLTGRSIPTLIPKGQPGVSLKPDVSCPPPAQLNPEVPPALSSLVMSCIEPDPSDRPDSMVRVSSRLEIAANQIAHSC